MADPVDPTVITQTAQAAEASLEDASNMALIAQQSFSGLNDVIDSSRQVLDQFTSKMKGVNDTISENQRLTEEQTTLFGLLSTAALGARNSFESLNNVDYSGISTFSKQFTDLKQIMDDSPFISTGQKIAAFSTALLGMGAPTDQVSKAAKLGVNGIIEFGAAFVKSADNGLKLQNSLIQLSAQVGGLSAVYDAAGPDLSNINILLNEQENAISGTMGATGLARDTIEKYYSQLALVPKALESNVSGLDAMGNLMPGLTNNTNLLTAATLYATGSGRQFSDVVDDLKIAFRDYNLIGEEALQFTARIGEISNRFGIELPDVRNAVRSTADAFKMFGNEAEGAATMMNEYIGAIQSTGVSGKVALDLIGNMTDGIKNLGIAQKGFLSAQTGGPGGLMGAFQIEKMLREGKIDEVFDKVRQSMSKQFGRIVSLEEASQSQAAAAQLTKQIMVLRQGPLGQFAKTDQEAIRMLEGFKARDEGRAVPALSETVVQDNMKAGTDINKKSYTELTRIRSILEATRGQANISNLGLFQRSATAGIGQQFAETGDIASDMRDNLNQYMRKSAVTSGEAAGRYGTALLDGVLIDKSGQVSESIIRDYSTFFDQVPDALKAPIDNIKQLFPNTNTVDADYQSYLSTLEQQSASIKEATANSARFIESQRNLGEMNLNEVGTVSPGFQLAGAAQQTTNMPNIMPVNTTPNNQTILAGVNNTNAIDGEITVNVQGYCLDCGEKHRGTTQSYSINTAQKAQK